MKLVLAGIVLFLILTATPAFAQVATPSSTTTEAGIRPSNPLFLLDRFLEELQTLFTLDPQAKVKLKLQFAAERLAEVKLEVASRNARGLDVALANLREQIANIRTILAQQQAQGADVSGLSTQAQLIVEAQEEELEELTEEEVKIEGLLTTLTDGEMVVAGITLIRSPLTRFEGAIALGSMVEVKAIPQADGTLLARKVELSDEPQPEVKVEGILTALTQTQATIAGLNFTITAQTKIEGPLSLGAMVEARAIPQQGSLIASKIEIEDELEEELEVKVKLVADDLEEESNKLIPLLLPQKRESELLKRSVKEAEEKAKEAAKELRKAAVEASKAAQKALKEEQKATEEKEKERAKSLKEKAKQAEKQAKEAEKQAREAQKRAEELRKKVEARSKED